MLAAIVRKELPKLARLVLGALITLDVHGRDMITEMVRNTVSYIFVILLIEMQFTWNIKYRKEEKGKAKH